MSGSNGPNQSPNMLARGPLRAAGVRRLNKRPVLLGGAAILVVVGAVGWTYNERAKRAAALADAASHRAHGGNGQDILAGAQGQPDAEKVANKIPIAPPAERPYQPVDNTPPEEDEATKARREAWRVYYQQLSQLGQEKFTASKTALMADTTPRSTNGAQMTGGGSVAGSSGAPGASPSAQASYAGQPRSAGGYGGFGGAPGGFPGQFGQLGAPPTIDGPGQRQKQAFLGQAGDVNANNDLMASIQGAVPDTVMQGTPVPAIMDGGANSDMPGMINAHVKDPVYDAATGLDLLIPAGSKLIGNYDNSVSQGQTRMAVIWTRIRFPDETSINLGAMAGADQAGNAGFKDKVDTHLWDKLGSAFLISLASAGAQLSQGTSSGGNNGYNSQQIASASIGQQFSQLGQEYARAGLSIPNTLEIRSGYPFVVMVNKDMHLRPWVDHRRAGAIPVNFGPMVR